VGTLRCARDPKYVTDSEASGGSYLLVEHSDAVPSTACWRTYLRAGRACPLRELRQSRGRTEAHRACVTSGEA
jgi:hypothetical protein